MRAPDPVAFSIGGLDIMWYGVLIGLGFLLAIAISYYRAPRHGIERDYVIDFTIFMIPASIIGMQARRGLFRQRFRKRYSRTYPGMPLWMRGGTVPAGEAGACGGRCLPGRRHGFQGNFALLKHIPGPGMNRAAFFRVLSLPLIYAIKKHLLLTFLMG